MSNVTIAVTNQPLNITNQYCNLSVLWPASSKDHVVYCCPPAPPYSHPIPTLFPPYSHLIRTLFPPYSHPIPTLFPPYSQPIPILFPTYSHPIPTLFPPYSHQTIPALAPLHPVKNTQCTRKVRCNNLKTHLWFDDTIHIYIMIIVHFVEEFHDVIDKAVSTCCTLVESNVIPLKHF